MPTCASSFFLASTASDSSVLTTASFTPSAGDVIVVKGVTDDSSRAYTAPSDTQGNTYTSRRSDTTGGRCFTAIWTAIAGSASSVTVSSSAPGASWHSLVVEVWTLAQLAGSPVTVASVGSGVPATALTTTAPGSAVSWLNGDWNAIFPGGSRLYDTTSASPTEVGCHDKSTSFYVAEYCYQAATSAGSQTFGLTSPSGQAYTLLGIEILDNTPAPGTDQDQAPMVLSW